MQTKILNKIVNQLAGPKALASQLYEDGRLVIIDQRGRKLRFEPEDYTAWLPKSAQAQKEHSHDNVD